jgi:hypothetical protein
LFPLCLLHRRPLANDHLIDSVAFSPKSSAEKGKTMRGFSQAILMFIVAGLARDHARLFTAKTTASKTTKTV